ncbi:MAG TPA: heavy-metal-associated domain-containing protein [Burkholderiaceae bacterium]|nr:heavy-metal-associated domain-containing protein [Burkholderiaceae bacterium]HMY99859.1 heavy-metal-associated domain-containing protein [Burkholderiaceae bacterium]HNB45753.1 heavy-metal-associated domain-containing protein [Burkholderiaceae bacterium]HNG80318.1 heavy-metal-associated domain-containing protein [Burkholderiaceae bacterium]
MIELTLPDMSCGHCVATVKKTLLQLDPQSRVEVDLPAHRVSIETSQSEERVRAVLAEEGYPAAA